MFSFSEGKNDDGIFLHVSSKMQKNGKTVLIKKNKKNNNKKTQKTGHSIVIVHSPEMGILRIFFSGLPIFRISADFRSFELSTL